MIGINVQQLRENLKFKFHLILIRNFMNCFRQMEQVLKVKQILQILM